MEGGRSGYLVAPIAICKRPESILINNFFHTHIHDFQFFLLDIMTSAPDLNASILRCGYAMSLMVFGSVVISLTWLIMRGIDGAEALQVNFYRRLALSVTIFGVMLWRFGRRAPQNIIAVGKPGLLTRCFLAPAGLCLL